MPKLLVIDTETGGLDPQRHSILSLGVVVWEDGEIRDELELPIAESRIVADEGALKVNQINLDEHRLAALAPADAAERLREFAESHFGRPPSNSRIPLVGHNVGFDVGFLRRLCRLAEFPYDRYFSHRVIDTAGIVRFLNLAGRLPLKGAGSTESFEYFGIKFEPGARHTALADARATAVLLTKLITMVRAP
jgi:DNA polymerase-3 subunit epsilon